MKTTLLLIPIALLATSAVSQDITQINLELLSADGNKAAGTVTLSQSDYGLVLTPNLSGLTPGAHGFHIHANGSCESSEKDGKVVLGGAAGGHFDPENTGKHSYPWEAGTHQGDLPALYVADDGTATYPVLAPKLKIADVQGKAIMVHAGGDNYSDDPKPLGGGGARMACGVIK